MEAAFWSASIGVPQRGQLVVVRDGESGHPQLMHFIETSNFRKSLALAMGRRKLNRQVTSSLLLLVYMLYF